MIDNNGKTVPKEIDADERDDEQTIVHETIPGDAPIVKDGGGDAREKGSTSTSDEDI